MSSPSILIVGNGIAGPVLASFLLLSKAPAHEKPHITILERASSSSRARGQNIDIRGTGVTIIRKLGLEKEIRAATTGEEGVQFVDSENRVKVASAVDKSGKLQAGTSDIEILRGRLAEILYNRSKQISEQVRRGGGGGIEYIFGDYLNLLDQDREKVHVRLGNSGEMRSFDLVVGADGLHSPTRQLAFGLDGQADRIKRLDIYGAFFSMPKASTDTLWRRWYRAPGRRSIMIRPSHQGGKVTVFMYVINEQDERLAKVSIQGLSAQKALLREYFHDAGWESQRVLKEMDSCDDFYYDMIAQVKMEKWCKGRIVLLGDAGYCASPVSGMGTTLALNGAHNCAGAITQNLNTSGMNFSAAFDQYELIMRPLVNRAQKLPLNGKAFYILNPETAWGIWVLHAILGSIHWSGVAMLVFKFVGPPANALPVEDYGLREIDERGQFVDCRQVDGSKEDGEKIDIG